MRKLLCFTVVILFWIGSSNGFADMFAPSHSCYKPSKPYQFNSEWEVSNFKLAVDTYRNCIQDFVAEQNDAVRKHKNAAENAISDWENYVSFELN